MPPAKERHKAVKDRIAKAKAQRPVVLESYLVKDQKFPSQVDAVLCKLCRQPIQRLVEDERFRQEAKVGDQYVINKRYVLCPLPNYIEITLECDDGSAHVTPLCKPCAVSLRPGDLEILYAADLQEFLEEEERTGHRINWDLYLQRTPVAVRKED